MNNQANNNTGADTAAPTKLRFGRSGSALTAGALLTVAVASASWFWLQQSDYEITEDAYVEGNAVLVTAQVPGTVTAINADNTDPVRAGGVLISLNPLDAQLALERNSALLARAVRQVRSQFSVASQMQANIAMRQEEFTRALADYTRRKDLVKTGAISGEDLQHTEHAMRAAQAALQSAQQQYAASHAFVDSTTVKNHPDVMSAASQVKDAYVALSRTTIHAPVAGIVAKRNVQVGQRVAPGTPLMSVVPLDDVWITANFQESQLKNIHHGQTVTLTADAYGRKVVYQGVVQAKEAGTGSAFSVMPAQNATGNWIKVVQRVPVRIALTNPEQIKAHPLQVGLSMRVKVDAREDKDLPDPQLRTTRSYRTGIFDQESADGDQLVARIIAENLSATDGGNQK